MYMPKIDQERCTKCGECIDVCPTYVIEDDDARTVIAHPEDCLGCESCLSVCSEEAIKVEEI